MSIEKGSGINRRVWIHTAYLLAIILLTSFAYSNVLHGEMMFDDKSILVDNPSIFSPSTYQSLNLFTSGTRPVTNFTFFLNDYFFGKDTFSYHLTNVIIHILNGVLVYILIYMTLLQNAVLPTTPRPLCPAGTPYQGGDKGKVRDDMQWIAFLTALFFSIHPIQTESVSYIIQRYESLSTFFYLASLIIFILAVESRFKIAWFTLFVIGLIFAFGSKEIAITLPVTAFVYGIYFFEKKDLWKKVALPGLLIFAGLVVAYVKVMSIGEGSSAGFSLKKFTALEYLFTQFSVMVTYLRLLIFPVGQNIDHVYPISRTFFETWTILSFTFLVALIIMALALFKRWRTGSFFILWFFIILSPTSSILPIQDPLVEHRLYLPAVGVFFIFASGIVKLFGMLEERLKRKSYIIISISLFISITGILCTATYKRNYLWNSGLAMWQDVLKKSPENARAYNNLGVVYQDKGMIDRAIEHVEIAVKMNSADWGPNLGALYLKAGMIDKGIEQYESALKVTPDDPKIHSALGQAYADKDRPDLAMRHFQARLRLRPDDSEAHNNLGNCYLLVGDYKNAIKEYLESLTIEPRNIDAFYNIGLGFEKLGDMDIAKEFYIEFIRNAKENHAAQVRKLSLKYNITGDTAFPDTDLKKLRQRALDELNKSGV